MTELVDKLELSNLYGYYGELLTSKQQEVFEYYFFEDLSIIEIAEINDTSKNAVYNSLKKSAEQLNKYEDILQIKKKFGDNIDLLISVNTDPKIIEQIK